MAGKMKCSPVKISSQRIEGVVLHDLIENPAKGYAKVDLMLKDFTIVSAYVHNKQLWSKFRAGEGVYVVNFLQNGNATGSINLTERSKVFINKSMPPEVIAEALKYKIGGNTITINEAMKKEDNAIVNMSGIIEKILENSGISAKTGKEWKKKDLHVIDEYGDDGMKLTVWDQHFAKIPELREGMRIGIEGAKIGSYKSIKNASYTDYSKIQVLEEKHVESVRMTIFGLEEEETVNCVLTDNKIYYAEKSVKIKPPVAGMGSITNGMLTAFYPEQEENFTPDELETEASEAVTPEPKTSDN